MLWTAHGAKLLPSHITFNFQYHLGKLVPASPRFLDIVTDDALHSLFPKCLPLTMFSFLSSLAYTTDTRRVPLKPSPRNQSERNHLALSSDGLRFFHPGDLKNKIISFPGTAVSHPEVDRL